MLQYSLRACMHLSTENQMHHS